MSTIRLTELSSKDRIAGFRTVAGGSVRVVETGSDGNEIGVPNLPLARYRFRFKPSGSVKVPAYAGSAWRGALGHALKKIVCVTHLDACQPCLLYRSCPYPYIFETPPPLDAQKMRKHTAVPHPFIIEPPETAGKDFYELGLTLAGRGNVYLPYFIHAFFQAGETGIGSGRSRLPLLDVWQAEPLETDVWTRIYEHGGTLKAQPPIAPAIPGALIGDVLLRFETPLRLQRDGNLVTPERFCFSDLFGALLRRVSMLTYFHTSTPLETDFAGLVAQARNVEPAAVRLVWKDWTRYSSRQRTSLQMGGLVGEMTVRLGEGSPFWPYLWLGQWIHVGKGTSMGLGRYRIEERQACHSGHSPDSGA